MTLQRVFRALRIALLVLLPATNALAPARCLALNPEWTLARPSNTGIPGEEIRCLGFDPDGHPWIGARWPFWQEGGFGVYSQAIDAWTVYSNVDSILPSEYVNDIAFAPDGTVWMATDGGLVRKQGDTWTVYDTSNSPLLHNVIRDIEVDSHGTVWLNNTNVQNQSAAVFEFTGTTWRRFSVPTELPWPDPWRQLNGLLVDRQDHVWVGNMSLKGVAEYNGQTWTLRGANLDLLVPQAADLSGGIWLITGGLGYTAYRWNGTQFIPFGGSNPPLSGTTITKIAVSPAGTVFIGNWIGQVVQSFNHGLTWASFGIVSDRVTGIAFDPASAEIWIGSAGAIHRLDANGAALHVYNTYNTGMPDFWIDRFNLDPTGNLWLASGEGGLSRFDGVRWRNWGDHNAGSEPYPFAGNEPMGCYHQDRAGTGWMGGNGIARWNPTTGLFDGFWNWQNNPGMGVGLWIYFAEDAAGHLFSAEKYGLIYRFDPVSQLWVQEPVHPYAVLGLPGMESDSAGNVWTAGWFDIYKWDGASWTTVTLPYGDYFYDLGGINCMAIGPDDVKWFGTGEGLVRWDGSTFMLFTTANSPLTINSVSGVDVDTNGRLGIAASGDQTTSSVAIVDGDPSVAANWSVFPYGQFPLAHWSLGQVAFDTRNDLWISCLSMGTVVMRVGAEPVAVAEPGAGQPHGVLTLEPVAPSPFQAVAKIRYTLVREDRVRCEIVDVHGRLVRTLAAGLETAGEHAVSWNGTDERGHAVPNGVYFGRVHTPGDSRTTRLVLMK